MKRISKFDVNGYRIHGMTMRTPSYDGHNVLWGLDGAPSVAVGVAVVDVDATADFSIYLCFEI